MIKWDERDYMNCLFIVVIKYATHESLKQIEGNNNKKNLKKRTVVSTFLKSTSIRSLPYLCQSYVKSLLIYE